MELIDKAAVVAEIEGRKKANAFSNEGGFEEDIDILFFLDTLEVKEVEEVDLEKELDFVKDAYYYFTSDERDSMAKVAKHFYELGLKVQKGE